MATVPLPLGSAFNQALLQYTNLSLDCSDQSIKNECLSTATLSSERRSSSGTLGTPSLNSVSEEEEPKDETVTAAQPLVGFSDFSVNHNKPNLSRLSLPTSVSSGPFTSSDVSPDSVNLISIALDRVRQYRSASVGERSILQNILHSKVGLVPGPTPPVGGIAIQADVMASNGMYSGENGWRGQPAQNLDYGQTQHGSPASLGRAFHGHSGSLDLQHSPSTSTNTSLYRPAFSSQSSYGSIDTYSGEHSRNPSHESLNASTFGGIPYGYNGRPTLPALEMGPGLSSATRDGSDIFRYKASPMLATSSSSGRLTHASNPSIDTQDQSPHLRTPPDFPISNLNSQTMQSPLTYQSSHAAPYDGGQSASDSYGSSSYWAGPHYNPPPQTTMYPPASFDHAPQNWQNSKLPDASPSSRPSSSQQNNLNSASRLTSDPYGSTPTSRVDQFAPPSFPSTLAPAPWSESSCPVDNFADRSLPLPPRPRITPPMAPSPNDNNAATTPTSAMFSGAGLAGSVTGASKLATRSNSGQGSSSSGNEWESYLQSYIKSYVDAPNRYAAGERKVVVHSPRVGQKSYGTEKRYLCPPPMATIIGNSWWNKEASGAPLNPPAVNIAISNEVGQTDSKGSWTTTHGRSFEESITQAFRLGEEPFIGRTSGKALHISEQADKKRIVKALVAIKAPSWTEDSGANKNSDRQPLIGLFESKEIKIISKPSKKRQSSKTSDLCIQHGTTISLFNRLRSQTSSTKFLAVTPTVSKQKGSDGKPLLTSQQLPADGFGFTADANCWDPFLLWLVDPSKPAPDTNVAPIPHGDGFLPPDDVISVLSSDPVPVIFYNNCIRLQCPNTGLLSPRFVVRRVESPTTVSGGDGTKKDSELGICPLGELPGDPVSQLHKVAFEIYQDPSQPIHGPDMLAPGSWLTCEGDAIKIRSGKTARTWSLVPTINTSPPGLRHARQFSNSLPSTPASYHTPLLPMTPRVGPGAGGPSLPPSAPVSPGGVYGSSFGSSGEGSYFTMQRKHSSSSSSVGTTTVSGQNTPWDDSHESSGPGPTRRRRGSSSASQSGYMSPMTTQDRLAHAKRGSIDVVSAGMTGMGITIGGAQYGNTIPQGQIIQGPIQPGYDQHGMMVHPYGQMMGAPPVPIAGGSPMMQSGTSRWIIEVSESATWTIVGTESKSYTFWIPPFVQELDGPMTPFVELHKYLPPGQAAEQQSGLKKYDHQFTSISDLPLATFYGSGFAKNAVNGEPQHGIWYGAEPSRVNEYRCGEVMGASIPECLDDKGGDVVPGRTFEIPGPSIPILLVKANGQCVYPTTLVYR